MPLPQFQIDPSSAEPLYRQIVAQVHRFIASGQLVAGTEMPSVRELAIAFAINPMTISKAYSLLETQRVLLRPRGTRMVVSAHAPESGAAKRLELLRPCLLTLIRQGDELGLKRAELLDALQQLITEQNQHEN